MVPFFGSYLWNLIFKAVIVIIHINGSDFTKEIPMTKNTEEVAPFTNMV